MTNLQAQFSTALAEIGSALGQVGEDELATACAAIAHANRIMVYGCGREGLAMRGLAMRLHHLGLSVSVQGDMAAPPLGKADLFITSAGPGELATVRALMGVAVEAGARVLFLTAETDTASAELADFTLTIPAQTMARDQGGTASRILPMGSVYEAAMGIMFEVMILRLRENLKLSLAEMRANHTNME